MQNEEPNQGPLISHDRLGDDSTEKVHQLYERSKVDGGWMGPNLQEVANTIGWSKNKLSRELRETYFEGWGETSVTTRGEVVRSKLEMRVADFFHRNDIQYQYEPDIRHIYKPDFILKNNIAVEVWGVQDNPKYAQRREEKEQMYAKSAWGLVSLEPLHMNRLSEIFPIESRKASIVEYAAEGQTNLQNFAPSSSIPSRNPAKTKKKADRDDATRQLTLNGHPNQAEVSDFLTENIWWENNEDFSHTFP